MCLDTDVLGWVSNRWRMLRNFQAAGIWLLNNINYFSVPTYLLGGWGCYFALKLLALLWGQDRTMFLRLTLNSWDQLLLPPWHPKCWKSPQPASECLHESTSPSGSPALLDFRVYGVKSGLNHPHSQSALKKPRAGGKWTWFGNRWTNFSCKWISLSSVLKTCHIHLNLCLTYRPPLPECSPSTPRTEYRTDAQVVCALTGTVLN